MYDRVKVAQEKKAKKTDKGKAESGLMNLLSEPFKDLYFFWEFEFGAVSNDATIGEVLKAYDAELNR